MIHSGSRLHSRFLRCWIDTHTKLELDMEGLSEFEQEVQEELEAAGACIYVKMGSNQA